MSELLQRVQNAVEKRRLFSRGQKILVAVSGGVDSMVLLHALHSLASKNRWQLSVAHFNHQLRVRASDGDEQFVRQTAAELRLKFFAERADVKAFASRAKLSVEMSARKLRHEFLARAAREQKGSAVALAHHAGDQVELFFLRLLRGAGGEGLAGMKWRSPSPADMGVVLVRPLLDFSKAELLAFAGEAKIRFRDDATNFSTDILRNRIRNELLPLLRNQYQPGLDKAVLRLMEIVGAETDFAGEAAERWKGKGFSSLPAAVQRKVLLARLREFGVAPDFDLVEQLREAPGQFVSVGTGISIARDAAGKIVGREHSAGGFKSAGRRLKLSGRAGRVEFAGRTICWSLSTFNGSRGRPPQRSESFDADNVGGEVILRHWRPGDRFQPIGMKSPVKLQDLFVNAKIPAARRRELVLAATATGEIFWVEGLRIGEACKLTPQTRRQLAWNWSK